MRAVHKLSNLDLFLNVFEAILCNMFQKSDHENLRTSVSYFIFFFEDYIIKNVKWKRKIRTYCQKNEFSQFNLRNSSNLINEEKIQ